MTEVVPGARPAELVPGEPDEVERLAARLTRFAASAGDAGARLGSLESGAWSGEAGQLFREAVGEVPSRLTRAAAAFGTAARALTAYARALREGQAVAARAVRMVEQSTPDTADADRQAATRLLAHARTEVEEAGRIAAERLTRAEADAPEAGDAVPGRVLGPGLDLRVVTEHQLTDPDGFVAPPGDWGDSVADMRFTSPHEVGFPAGAVGAVVADLPAAGSGEAGWQAWAAADSGRQLGAVEPGVLAAVGVAAVGLRVIGRRRHDRTALGLVGLDEAELRRRREEFGGARHRDGMLTAARTVQLRGRDAWRTRLASVPRSGGTVQHWAGPGADPLPRARVAADRSGSVDRDVLGAVLRTGRPAHEGA